MAKAIAMCLLNFRNFVERCRDFWKPLFFCHIAKGSVYRIVFFVFVVLSVPQQLHHVIGNIHGIAAVDLDTLASEFLHVIIKNLCMLLFLVGGKLKNSLYHMQLLPLAYRGGKGIAVACLALPRKRTH